MTRKRRMKNYPAGGAPTVIRKIILVENEIKVERWMQVVYGKIIRVNFGWKIKSKERIYEC